MKRTPQPACPFKRRWRRDTDGKLRLIFFNCKSGDHHNLSMGVLGCAYGALFDAKNLFEELRLTPLVIKLVIQFPPSVPFIRDTDKGRIDSIGA